MGRDLADEDRDQTRPSLISVTLLVPTRSTRSIFIYVQVKVRESSSSSCVPRSEMCRHLFASSALLRFKAESLGGGIRPFVVRAIRSFRYHERVRAKNVFFSAAELPPGASFIAGHFSLDTLTQAYSNAQLMIILREPICRLISHWLYWRSATAGHLNSLGGWGHVVRSGQHTLEEFLKFEPALAQTDNVTLRMLLHPQIAPDKPIKAADDDRLLGCAMPLLRRFDFLDTLENKELVNNISQWLDRDVVLPSENVTSEIPTEWHGDLSEHLTPGAVRLLLERTRLDREIWRWVAGELADEAHIIASALPKFANILDPGSKHSRQRLSEVFAALSYSLVRPPQMWRRRVKA